MYVPGSIIDQGCQGRENLNAQSLLFSNAGFDFSATFSAADLLPLCYRYAVYMTDHTSISYDVVAFLCVPCQVHMTVMTQN